MKASPTLAIAIAFATCYVIILAPFGADTNSPATNAPTKALSTNETPKEAKATNAPVVLQSPKDLVSKTDTNSLMSVPIVQQMISQAFDQGVQFGVAASIQNKNLAEMGDAQALYRVALFLRFGGQPKK